MNGIHDMGGMLGMGPLLYEKDEPVFHAEWEGRVYAMAVVLGMPPGGRFQIESIPAAEYLRMTYYERWLRKLAGLLVQGEVVTREEIETGRPAPGAPKGRAATAAEALARIARGTSARRAVAVPPRFAPGQRVRARNLNPVTHTRLPRYARGRTGTVDRDHGVFVFPDTAAHDLGEKPQHVYSVRFSARELWGEQAPARDSVYIDMWDDYLEPA